MGAGLVPHNGENLITELMNCRLMNNEDTKLEILQLTGFSSRLEKILLALLRDQAHLKSRVENDHAELAFAIEKVNGDLLQEKNERTQGIDDLKLELDNQGESFSAELSRTADEISRTAGFR